MTSTEYDGYLYVHFKRESADGEQIYFALSDGQRSAALPRPQRRRAGAVLDLGERGVRDPHIVRSPDGDRFSLVATDLRLYAGLDWDRHQRQRQPVDHDLGIERSGGLGRGATRRDRRRFDHLGAIFDGVEDAYLRERKGDLADVVGRLRMNLTPGGSGFRDVLGECEAPCILVADELPPSIAAQLDWTKFQAFITDAGSRTYHTAILARSLHVPAVVGLHDATARILPGTLIVVDGDEGTVSIDPPLHVVDAIVAGSRHATQADVVRGAGTIRRAEDSGRRGHSSRSRTSICLETRRSPCRKAPKGSASFDRSCCWQAVPRTT